MILIRSKNERKCGFSRKTCGFHHIFTKTIGGFSLEVGKIPPELQVGLGSDQAVVRTISDAGASFSDVAAMLAITAIRMTCTRPVDGTPNR